MRLEIIMKATIRIKKSKNLKISENALYRAGVLRTAHHTHLYLYTICCHVVHLCSNSPQSISHPLYSLSNTLYLALDPTAISMHPITSRQRHRYIATLIVPVIIDAGMRLESMSTDYRVCLKCRV